VTGRGAGARWRRAVAGTAVGLALLGAAALRSSDPAMALTPGTHTFTITATVRVVPAHGFPALACGSALGTLDPGVTRCLEVQVTNHLDLPIVVENLATSLDPAYPAVAGCSAADLALPSLSTPFDVPAAGTATGPAMPILLRSTAANQDGCKDSVIHLAFTGSAVRAATSGPTPDGPLAFTGADTLATLLVGGGLVLLGLVLVLVAGRRRGADREAS